MARYSRRVLLVRAGAAVGGASLLGLLAACSSPAAVPAVATPNAPTSAPAAAPATGPTTAPATPASRPPFSVAYTSMGGFNAPLWLADTLHLFDQAGVSATLSLVQANNAVAALLGGTVDSVLQSAAPVITADLNGNADLVFTASTDNRPVFALYAAQSIPAAADLKNKVLATDRPGTPNDYGARALLAKLGLQFSDIRPLPVGGSTNTVAALLSGQAQAAVLTPPESFRAEAAGFHQIANIYDGVYQGAGIVMQRARLNDRGPALVPFLRGLKQGIQAYNAQPDQAKQVLTDYTQETDATIVARTYDFYRTQAPFELDLRPTTQGIQIMIDFLVDTVPAAKTARADQFVDSRFVDQLA